MSELLVFFRGFFPQYAQLLSVIFDQFHLMRVLFLEVDLIRRS